MNKKILATSIVILFIGLALAPSIHANTNKEALGGELVEITTEVCGINGQKHTVQLTQQEADELDALFDSIKARLDNTESRDEAVEIFNEAIVELDKYGLLGGLSVKQAQKLVTGPYQNPRAMDILDKLDNRYLKTLDENENRFCLIAGKTDVTTIVGIFKLIGTSIAFLYIVFFITLALPLWILMGILEDQYPLIYDIVSSILDRPIMSVLQEIFIIRQFLRIFLLQNVPWEIFGSISFGWKECLAPNIPSSGWVWTRGLNGIKTWNGSFYGRIKKVERLYFASHDFYIGVLGFTGLKISTDMLFPLSPGKVFYLGGAARVKIGPEPLP